MSTIREEYLGQLEILEWMSANTKSLAAEKRECHHTQAHNGIADECN